MTDPTATFREVDGQLVLDDPEALGVIAAVEAHNRRLARKGCRRTLDLQVDRVQHFLERIAARNMEPSDVVIVLISVDDSAWTRDLADALMPDSDWQAIRNRGEVPFARGLAGRAGIVDALDFIDPGATDALLRAHGPGHGLRRVRGVRRGHPGGAVMRRDFTITICEGLPKVMRWHAMVFGVSGSLIAGSIFDLAGVTQYSAWWVIVVTLLQVVFSLAGMRSYHRMIDAAVRANAVVKDDATVQA